MLSNEQIASAIQASPIMKDVDVFRVNPAGEEFAVPVAWLSFPEMEPAERVEAALESWRRVPGDSLSNLVAVLEESAGVALVRLQAGDPLSTKIGLAYVILNSDGEPRIFVGHPPSLEIRSLPYSDLLPEDFVQFYSTVHNGLVVEPYEGMSGPGLVPACKFETWAQECGQVHTSDLQFGWLDESQPLADPNRLVSTWSAERSAASILINLDAPQVFDVVGGVLTEKTYGRYSALAIACSYYLGFVRTWEEVDALYPT
ncbi:hypothetical protein FK529_09220 [Tsukamurella asaccharolytica]|uniref:SMI1/KNR4 family protein n=1 Tax=Tsukamurella asaccharolytica TaxID=2592067 RepID=A0A5C5RB70_9ACTN|nr:hypothetical protein [Tsukamurella asaccharolytica]TWS19375.1 hypothetical protein FK529_09220 [Tsukamurella asaccharolytica]